MPTLRLPRCRLPPGAVSIVYLPAGGEPRGFGRWRCARNGVIDAAGPPQLSPDLADWIELMLAMGRTFGLIRAPPEIGVSWHWKFCPD